MDSLSSLNLGYIDFKNLGLNAELTYDVVVPTNFTNLSGVEQVKVKFDTTGYESKVFTVPNVRVVNAPEGYTNGGNTERIQCHCNRHFRCACKPCGDGFGSGSEYEYSGNCRGAYERCGYCLCSKQGAAVVLWRVHSDCKCIKELRKRVLKARSAAARFLIRERILNYGYHDPSLRVSLHQAREDALDLAKRKLGIPWSQIKNASRHFCRREAQGDFPGLFRRSGIEGSISRKRFLWRSSTPRLLRCTGKRRFPSPMGKLRCKAGLSLWALARPACSPPFCWRAAVTARLFGARRRYGRTRGGC